MSIEKELYGCLNDNTEVYKYIVENKNGLKAELITYGATLDSMTVPDKDGVFEDILIGFSDLKGHVERSDYQGMTVGRYANRIAKGRYIIDEKTYEVTHNENETCLHGGGEFSHAVWQAEVLSPQSLKMTYVSPDGSNGFNGEMTVSVVFTLDEDNLLSIDYTGSCTEKTIMNFTNHAYFNLGGYAAGTVSNHLLEIDAAHYTPMDKDSIPTGKIAPVKNTPFDFTTAKPIGQDMDADDEQIKLGNGYDHNFCLNKSSDDAVKATVICPETGRKMQLYTDLPGVQLYTGNFLDNIEGKNGTKMNRNDGFCLETQFYPDTPNHDDFPSCVVEKNTVFKTKTAFRFCLINKKGE